MSQPVREQLLGYLLGALEEDEHREVKARLLASPQLQQELAHLRETLRPLAADRVVPPPQGLWQRTCRLVEIAASAIPVNRSTPRAAVSLPTRRWSLRDALTAAVVLLATCCVLFPAVQRSRFQAGVTACQNHLGQLGMALLHYGENHGGHFPQAPQEGNDAFAGMYSVMLRDHGLLPDPRIILCPAVASSRGEPLYVPSLCELQQARERRLVELRRSMTGDYGYTLGVMVNGRCVPVRNQGRTIFAIMADTPSLALDGLPSANHGGLGQNVLFEYGNVRFLRSGEPLLGTDYLFLNDAWRVAPGTHPDDSVIAPCHARPMLLEPSSLER
jgi:hypothetical protein